MNLSVQRLGNVAEFIRGITFKPKDVMDLNNNSIGCMRTKNVQDDLDCRDVWGIDRSFIKNKKQYLMEGDILISSANSWNLVGKGCWIPKLDYECTFGGFISVLRANDEKVFPRYLYYWYTSNEIQNKIRSFGQKTTNISNLNLERCSDLELPTPPLPEQKRIAAILDKADSLRRKNQQAIQLADKFLRAVFLDMFGELFCENGYRAARKKPISELTTYIDYRGKTPEKSESGVPLITAKNVKKGFISEEPREFIPESNYESWMTRGQPLENDVLFTTEAPLGNAALLGRYAKIAVGQRLVSLRSKGELTQEYLLYCLLNPYIQNLIDQKSSGSTAKGIRTKELYQIELPIPEINKQNEFSNIYRKTVAINKEYNISEYCSYSLFNALSQKAFASKL